jgi:hemerythrin-like domain-containing protein
MLRNKNLIPLSHQHQHALALCVRLDRAIQAKEVDLAAWQEEIQQIYEQEIGIHFAAEEQELFPAAARVPELQALVADLVAEHARLRDLFARAGARKMDARDLESFWQSLSAHIRKEERQLFESVQRILPADQLALLGAALDKALRTAGPACLVPRPGTQLRPRRKTK